MLALLLANAAQTEELRMVDVVDHLRVLLRLVSVFLLVVLLILLFLFLGDEPLGEAAFSNNALFCVVLAHGLLLLRFLGLLLLLVVFLLSASVETLAQGVLVIHRLCISSSFEQFSVALAKRSVEGVAGSGGLLRGRGVGSGGIILLLFLLLILLLLLHVVILEDQQARQLILQVRVGGIIAGLRAPGLVTVSTRNTLITSAGRSCNLLLQVHLIIVGVEHQHTLAHQRRH